MNPAFQAIVLPVFFLLFSFSSSYAASFYHWVDQNGTYHFTNDYERIPLAYRNQVHLWVVEDTSEKESPPTPRATSHKEETRKDIFGLGEEWWREKVLTRREQLKEAVENYEKAYKKYSKSIEQLGPWRFGGLSLTQYQMFSGRLDAINSEMTGYEAQVAEASERLKKLLKEAEQSKVNPDWFK